MKLQIDFKTQQNNAARNDCGAACIAMVAGESVDDVLLVANRPKNEPLHLGAIMATLRAYRLPHEHVRPLHLPDARRWLANGNPIIALVNYGRLPAALKATDYNGNHYVVVVGFAAGGVFLVHDPLWPDETGAYRRWADTVMGEAWANPINAMPLQGVVVQRQYAIAEPSMEELGLVVSETLREETAVQYLEMLLQALRIEPGPLPERVGRALAQVVGMERGRVIAD